MGDLSANFSRYEFRCKCGCSFDTVDSQLVTELERIRAFFGDNRITITSGNRCRRYNTSVTGNPLSNSQHLYSKAVDIQVHGISPSKIFAGLESLYPGAMGLGDGESFTHFDVRPIRGRWAY